VATAGLLPLPSQLESPARPAVGGRVEIRRAGDDDEVGVAEADVAGISPM
jgi:hypothetical protein